MSAQQYAVPKPYWTAANDLDRLRQQLADAETTAERAADWTTRTRAEQDVKQLRRQLNSAELDQQREQSRQSEHARHAAEQRRVAPAKNGAQTARFAPTKPYFAATKTIASPTVRAENTSPNLDFEQLNRAVAFAREAGLFLK